MGQIYLPFERDLPLGCERLSYAGRLQLIRSVLFSIQVYWSCILFFLAIAIDTYLGGASRARDASRRVNQFYGQRSVWKPCFEIPRKNLRSKKLAVREPRSSLGVELLHSSLYLSASPLLRAFVKSCLLVCRIERVRKTVTPMSQDNEL